MIKNVDTFYIILLLGQSATQTVTGGYLQRQIYGQDLLGESQVDAFGRDQLHALPDFPSAVLGLLGNTLDGMDVLK